MNFQDLVAAFTAQVAAAAAAPGPGGGPPTPQDLALLGAAVVAANLVRQPIPRAQRAPPAPAPPLPALLVTCLSFLPLPVRISRDQKNVYAMVAFLSALMTMSPRLSVRVHARAQVLARAAIPTVWDHLWEAVVAIEAPPPVAAAGGAPAGGGAAVAEARALAALLALHRALPQPVGTLGTVVAALLVEQGAPAEFGYLRGSTLEIRATHAGGVVGACGATAVLPNILPGAVLLVDARPEDRSFGDGVVRGLRSGAFPRLRLHAGAGGPPPRNPVCNCPPGGGSWAETACIIAPPLQLAVPRRPLVLFEIAREVPVPIRVQLGGAYMVPGEQLIDDLEARLVAALVSLGGP